ncbi:unnamed protein product [Paramecium pentaurelia]|uniref:Uncharacterized protein n=1 Tax=Paramecium pentaurelia TaxID=43138 RepID=A0A8S1S6E8_9CILI|nr:unnamed protein product [Paramecium pentaurelia]
MNCRFHPQTPISLICTAPHRCEINRKMCVECQQDHGIEVKQTIPINKFRQMLNGKVKDYKLDDTQELNKQRLDFKYMLSKAVEMLKQLWEELSESIRKIFEMIEKENKSLTDLITQNENLTESSYSDLEKLVQLLNGKIVDNLNNKKNSIMTKVKKAKDLLEKEVIIFCQKFKEEMREILSIFQVQNDEQIILQEGSQKLKVAICDHGRFIYSNLTIQSNQNKEIQYLQDGSIIRTDQIRYTAGKPEILTNLEQIKHLQWFGQLRENNHKVGIWTATWQGEKIKDVGGQYSNEGKKQGKWQELIENYSMQSNAFEIGEYDNGTRIGNWKYLYDNKEMYKSQIQYGIRNGGNYNQQGNKNGKWQEIWEGFWKDSQVFYNGEYKNGKKVARWDIVFENKKIHLFACLVVVDHMMIEEMGLNRVIGLKFRMDFLEILNWCIVVNIKMARKLLDGIFVKLKKGFYLVLNIRRCKHLIYKPQQKNSSGGGSYDEGDNGIKQGNWVELSDALFRDSQVTYSGQYKNGKKVTKWDIWYQENGHNQKNLKIGGGSYDEGGDETKQGEWVEISDGFYQESQVTYNGQYKNGKKVDRWNICLIEKVYQMIYNPKKQEVENMMHDNFSDSNQITYHGEYKNGAKVGIWEILKMNKTDYFELKLENQFHIFIQDSNIILRGKIFNGKRAGKWDILYGKIMIGGGSFGSQDEKSHGIKCGKWVEISEEFNCNSQVTYSGEYINGQKTGRWNIYQFKENQFIWCGSQIYDFQGNLIQKENNNASIIYMGNLQNGRKVGRWNILFQKNYEDKQIEKMQRYQIQQCVVFSGGGQYEEGVDEVKQGNWVEISDGYTDRSQITYIGEYKNGKKIGNWDIKYNRFENGWKNEKIGGGQYDKEDNGMKSGEWVENIENFTQDSQVTYQGNYKNGKKIGRWDVWYKKNGDNRENLKMYQKYFQSIIFVSLFSGGGQYDTEGNGIKSGEWVEQIENFKWDSQVTYLGNYKNGKKIGRWNILFRKQFDDEYKLIGGGQYDTEGNGIKSGEWVEQIENFKWDSQVTYQGNYKNGKKIGRWNILFRKQNEDQSKQIGGGSYDEIGDEFKQGNWVEISEENIIRVKKLEIGWRWIYIIIRKVVK